MKIISSNFLHSSSSECQTTMKIPPIRRKRKASRSSKSKCMSKHIEVNVVENGTTTGTSPSHDKGPSTAFLTAIQEGFVQKSANMANAITEAFKSFKVNLKTFPMMMTLKRKIPSIQTVRVNQCDNCDLWYQTKCCSGCDKMYHILASSPCTWVCVDCGLPSFSNSLIDTSLDLFNSFSLLDSLLQEFSSLQQSTFTETSNDKPNKERCSNKNNLKKINILSLNCNSIRSQHKSGLLKTLIDSEKLHIILGCDSKLDSSISRNEVFPQDYKINKTSNNYNSRNSCYKRNSTQFES